MDQFILLSRDCATVLYDGVAVSKRDGIGG